MDTPSLKAFVSPRSNSRRKPSDHDQTRPTKCHSSKLLQLLDKGSLNQCIRDLQSSLKQECSRIQSKLKSSHQRIPSSSKENINPHQSSTYKSCQNLKKPASRSVVDRQTRSKARLRPEDSQPERSSRKLAKLIVNTEVEWLPSKKMELLLGQVQTTTNVLTKTFQKEATPKPKTIKNLFQKRSEKQLRRALGRSQLASSMGIKNFTIVRKLGKGRFGNVYLAQYQSNLFRDKQTQAVVALKSISKKVILDNSMIGQLAQEIKIQTFLNHPNLLKMYGCFSDHDSVYLVLENALGGNLFRELRQEVPFRSIQKRFSEKKCAVYLRQVCQAVAYLHRHGIIHRDIKPENILLSGGMLKLSDFGWSVYSPELPRQTFCGTLDYVSPEIVVGKTYDNRVDIWSIGVLCYEMATGRAPFENQGHQDQTYQKIMKTEFDYPDHLSQGIRDFIDRLLVRNPRKRMSLEQALQHEWLTENSRGGLTVSREIYNSYSCI